MKALIVCVNWNTINIIYFIKLKNVGKNLQQKKKIFKCNVM